MNTDKYEIPLHPWEDDYDEKQGLYAVIQNGRSPSFMLIDYSSDEPFDAITMGQREVYGVLNIMMSWLASETKLHGKFSDEYGEHKE